MAGESVTVYVDGRPVSVPKRVGSWLAVRGALGAPRGLAVAIECDEGLALLGTYEDDTPGQNVRFWEFSEGERYRLIGFDQAAEFGLLPEAEDEDPADWWKRP